MPSGSGKALDFGCGPSYLALIAARRGFDVTAVDLQPIRMPYIYPRLRFIQGDVLHRLSEAVFDLVINCSTIEHVGLAGRYGVTENRSGGDIEAMARLQKLMKADGVMLLTIPVGQDAVFAPYHRVYGKKRLPQLLDGYIVSKEEFWIKDESNRWLPCDKEAALDFGAEWNSRKKVYALGLFVLGRP
jgi:SAM-dependent methyltransferase